MYKQIKGCLLFLGIILLLISMIFGWFYYGMITSNERQNEDNIECENKDFVDDYPLITIDDKSVVYDSKIYIYLLDQNDTIEKKLIYNKGNQKIELNLPFNNFKKTKNILIVTNNAKYLISDMKYYNDGHWGMFGYLGCNREFIYSVEKIK